MTKKYYESSNFLNNVNYEHKQLVIIRTVQQYKIILFTVEQMLTSKLARNARSSLLTLQSRTQKKKNLIQTNQIVQKLMMRADRNIMLLHKNVFSYFESVRDRNKSQARFSYESSFYQEKQKGMSSQIDPSITIENQLNINISEIIEIVKRVLSNPNNRSNASEIIKQECQSFITNLINLINSEQFFYSKEEAERDFGIFETKQEYELFQSSFLIISQLKGAGLKAYDEDVYRQLSLIASQLFDKLSLRPIFLKYIELFTTENKVQLKEEQQDKFSVEEEEFKQKNIIPKRQCVPVQFFSVVMLSFWEVPQEKQVKLLSLILQNIDIISNLTLSFFMMDTVVNRKQLEFSFFNEFDSKIKAQTWNNCHRYAFLTFANYFLQQGYQSFYSSQQGGFRIAILECLGDYESVLNYAKLLALEYEVMGKCASRSFVFRYQNNIINFQKVVATMKFNLIQLIKIFNILSKTYPLRNQFMKEIALFQNYKIDENSLEEIKTFVLYNIQNLKPEYIYSVDENPKNHIHSQTLSLVKMLAKKVIDFDPKFFLEVTSLFNSKSDLTVLFSQKIIKISLNLLQQILNQNFEIKNLFKKEEDLPEDLINLEKLIDFICLNESYLSLQKIKPYIVFIYNKLMSMDSPSEHHTHSWKFIYQICELIKSSEKKYYNIQDVDDDEEQKTLAKEKNQKVISLFQKLCLKYIQQNQDEQNMTIFRNPCYYEEYIMKICYLVGQSYFSTNPERAKELANFVNHKFIYSTKSVRKYAIYQVLQVLDWLPDINPQIHGYLFSNLSTFILYIQSLKRFYLRRNRNFQNDNIYIELLKYSARNCEILRKVENKDRLNIIKVFLLIFWKKISNKQIARILVAFEDPHFMTGDRIRKVLRAINFKKEDLKGIDLSLLIPFKSLNKSLLEILMQEFPDKIYSFEMDDMKLTNERTPEEIRDMFLMNNQLYEKAFESKEFMNEHLIPEPSKSTDSKIKMIYICLKIVQKIRASRSYTLANLLSEKEDEERNDGQKDNDKKKIPSIKMAEELKYISDNNLIKISHLNQFKLDNIETSGHHEMVEGWSYFDDTDSIIQIQDYSTFSNASENVYERLIMAVHGNIDVIKQISKKEFMNPVVYETLSNFSFDLTVESKGSLFQIVNPNEGMKTLHLLCSNEKNQKLQMIMAYVLEQVGHKVCIVGQNDSTADIVEVIESYFNLTISKDQDPIDIDIGKGFLETSKAV